MLIPIKINNLPRIPNYFWHPSVIYIPERFGNYKWWMAQSPYHPMIELQPYRARWEYPCVYYSNDGLTWHSISNNPLDDLSIEQIQEECYFSDPHLVYRNGNLELYYRLTLLHNKQIIGNKTILYKKTSKDGVTWSSHEIVADLRRENDIVIWGEQIISQAIVWTGEKYICWYVDGSGYQKQRGIRLTYSKDGVHWEPSKKCSLEGYMDTPWHIDVQKYDENFHMLVYGDTKTELAHLVSVDGITWNMHSIILRPEHNKWYSFYSDRIYRSCSVKVSNAYYIYFSAATTIRSYIGLLKTKDWEHFEHLNPFLNTQFMLDLVKLFTNKIIKKCKKILHIK